MDDDVICLDSDEEEQKETPSKDEKLTVKRPVAIEVSNDESPERKIRRIQPIKIGEIDVKEKQVSTSSEEVNTESSNLKIEELPADPTNNKLADVSFGETSFESQETEVPITSAGKRNEFTEELQMLIKACRAAEPSADMKTIIKKKLLKYYHIVHPKYVISKGFLVLLKETTEEINKQPHLVYSKLKLVIDELDTRRKAVYIEPLAPLPAPENGETSKTEESGSQNVAEVEVQKTGDKTKDLQLKKLYQALRKAKRAIADLEEEEVDLDDDLNSAYLKKVRYEKRACEIYKKICEITGESAHAHRLVKKPISFKGTSYTQFNKRLQKNVNRTGSFPNYRDVLKLLDFCNKTYNYSLSREHQEKIARDAFTELGKILQDRRKADLYESATFYTGKNKDPAKNNPALRSQLEKNKKNYAKIDDIINEFTLKPEREEADDNVEDPGSSQATEEYSDHESSQQMSADEQQAKMSDSIIEIDESPVKNSDANFLRANNNDDDDDLILIS